MACGENVGGAKGRRVRVLQLMKVLNRGGAEVLMLHLCRRMSSMGYDFDVAYFASDLDDLVPDFEECGASVVCLDASTQAAMFRRLPRLVRLIRERQPDLVHCHLPLPGVVGRIAGRLTGTPVVYTEHAPVDRYHPLTRFAHESTWRLQDQVIACSDAVGRSFTPRMTGVPVEVIQNGIDTERLRFDEAARSEVRNALGIPDDAFVLGHVAVFRQEKRLDLWLELATRVLHEAPDTHFLLVGGGPLDEEVRDQWTTIARPDRIHLPGMKADVAPYLSAMDAYLMTSDFEGLPIALLEALSVGLPVVSTAAGGVPEVITAETGIVVDCGDVEALRSAVLTLVNDRDRAEAMGRRGRAAVIDGFSLTRMMSDLDRVYRRVLGGCWAQ